MQADIDADSVLVKYDRLIRSMAIDIAKDSIILDDLVQEGRLALIEVIRSPDLFLSAQLWTFARKRVLGAMLNHLKKVTRDGGPREQTDELSAEDNSPADDALSEGLLLQEMRRSRSELAAEYQEVLRLRFDEGRTIRDIAACLKLPLITTERRLKDAMDTLRERVETRM